MEQVRNAQLKLENASDELAAMVSAIEGFHKDVTHTQKELSEMKAMLQA